MIHGALSASNMDISGAMLDLPTQSTQPRTAPVWLLDYSDSIFGSEHTARAVYLAPIYRKLLRNVPESNWKKFNLELLNIRGEMAQAYDKYLQVQLLSAAGLKTEVAGRIQAEHSGLAERFSNLIIEMSSLRNRGALSVAKSVVEDVAVLDVFNLLGTMPQFYFANPAADHRAFIYDQLKPILKGNRFHRARKESVIKTLVDRFADLYRELMSACRAYAGAFYGDFKNMRESILARAGFENVPLQCLYSVKLFKELRQTGANYRATGNVRMLSEAIDERIAASMRSVDRLLIQGGSRRLSSGGIEIQMRTIAGVNYSVRCWNDQRQTRLLHVGIPAEFDCGHYRTSAPDLQRLSKRQIDSLRYGFTTDGWKTCGEARARLVHDERDGRIISFRIPCKSSLVGRLEGAFHMAPSQTPHSGDQAPLSKGYVFAIPDKHELMSMVAGH